jgi:hypothetical protein
MKTRDGLSSRLRAPPRLVYSASFPEAADRAS